MAEAEGLDMTLDQIIQKRESNGVQRFGARKSWRGGRGGYNRPTRGGQRWAGRRQRDRSDANGNQLRVNLRVRKVIRRPERWSGQQYQVCYTSRTRPAVLFAVSLFGILGLSFGLNSPLA